MDDLLPFDRPIYLDIVLNHFAVAFYYFYLAFIFLAVSDLLSDV